MGQCNDRCFCNGKEYSQVGGLDPPKFDHLEQKDAANFVIDEEVVKGAVPKGDGGAPAAEDLQLCGRRSEELAAANTPLAEQSSAELNVASPERQPPSLPASAPVSVPADESAAACTVPSPRVEPPTSPPLGFQEKRLAEIQNAGLAKPRDVMSSMPRRPSVEGKTMDTYAALHWAAAEKILAMESMAGWTLKKTIEGTAIYTRQEGGNVCFKAVADIFAGDGDAGLARILALILNVEERPQWDDMCLEGKVVQTCYPFYRITHVKFAAPSVVIQNRDLCIIGRVMWLEDGGCIMMLHSVESPDAPTSSDFVRAEMLKGGYILRPKAGAPGTFRFVWCGCVDPKGWIPQWVANITAWKQGLTVVKIKQYLARKAV